MEAQVTSDTDLIEYLGDRVAEGRVLMAVETDRTGDPERYRIGVKALGESEHAEYVAGNFREALFAALREEDAIPADERRLDMWEWDEPPSEEVETLIACLGDDAAQLMGDNPEDERAATMLEAADMLARLEKANRQLFAIGQKMYAALPVPQGQAPSVDALMEAANAAATSLETISQLAGHQSYGSPPIPTYMTDFADVRGYAASRARVAREAIAAVQRLVAQATGEKG